MQDGFGEEPKHVCTIRMSDTEEFGTRKVTLADVGWTAISSSSGKVNSPTFRQVSATRTCYEDRTMRTNFVNVL